MGTDHVMVSVQKLPIASFSANIPRVYTSLLYEAVRALGSKLGDMACILSSHLLSYSLSPVLFPDVFFPVVDEVSFVLCALCPALLYIYITSCRRSRLSISFVIPVRYDTSLSPTHTVYHSLHLLLTILNIFNPPRAINFDDSARCLYTSVYGSRSDPQIMSPSCPFITLFKTYLDS